MQYICISWKYHRVKRFKKKKKTRMRRNPNNNNSPYAAALTRYDSTQTSEILFTGFGFWHLCGKTLSYAKGSTKKKTYTSYMGIFLCKSNSIKCVCIIYLLRHGIEYTEERGRIRNNIYSRDYIMDYTRFFFFLFSLNTFFFISRFSITTTNLCMRWGYATIF